MPENGSFPSLYAVLKLPHSKAAKGGSNTDGARDSVIHNNNLFTFFDVKFNPYDDNPVFAILSSRDVYIMQPTSDPKKPVEIIDIFRDPQSPLNGDPLVCFGGAGSGEIRIVDVRQQKLVRELGGHGGAINDLAISPLTPTILASASADHSIRLWNLDPTWSKRPCAAILAGPDAHRQPVLTIAFHCGGRYLLSGGTDTMVNLWALPEVPDIRAGKDKTSCIYFPLFSSTEVHSDYVDCVRFYGDLILSHAAASSRDSFKHDTHNVILLWKIVGFNANLDPSSYDPPVSEPGIWTRSSFGGKFQRLLTFEMPHTTPFYMRFSLFDTFGFIPMLAMGDENSKYLFWDLGRIEQELAMLDDGTGPTKSTVRSSRNANSEEEEEEEEDTLYPNFVPAYKFEYRARASRGGRKGGSHKRRPAPRVGGPQNLSNPFWPIPAHHEVIVPKYDFTTRQVAWSHCGRWMVSGGNFDLICVFRRSGEAPENEFGNGPAGNAESRRGDAPKKHSTQAARSAASASNAGGQSTRHEDGFTTDAMQLDSSDDESDP